LGADGEVSDPRSAGCRHGRPRAQERLVENGHGIQIIILSAHGDAEVHARALAAGAIAFLSKPVDGDTLLSMVEQALGRR
jgi:two-component system response regulator FixJ